jgi:hypothetical protein
MRLYVILVDLLLQDSEVLPIRRLRVGFVPLQVYSAEISTVKFILMSGSKGGRLVLARLCTT